MSPERQNPNLARGQSVQKKFTQADPSQGSPQNTQTGEQEFVQLLENHFNAELHAAFRKAKSAESFTLETIEQAWSQADFKKPQRTIHVVGTNGKGTACYYIEALTRAQSQRAGVFTSPHLLEINERFRVDGQPADYKSLVEGYHSLKSRIAPETFAHLSFFELTFLIACALFEEKKAQVWILEAGLGGRLDATKVARGDTVLLTGIALDHMQMLGHTLPKILNEKLHILQLDQTEQTLYYPIANSADKDLILTGIQKLPPNKCTFVEVSLQAPISHSQAPGQTWPWPKSEVANRALRLAMAVVGQKQPGGNQVPLPSPELPPGRLERHCYDQGIELIFDCAHNEQAVGHLIRCLEAQLPLAPTARRYWVHLGFLGDKDKSFTQPLLNRFTQFGQSLAVEIEWEVVDLPSSFEASFGQASSPFFRLPEPGSLKPGTVVVIAGSFRLYRFFTMYKKEVEACLGPVQLRTCLTG